MKVANAVGAALCQVSGCEEILLNMTGLSKTEALEKLRTCAFEKCLMNGAKRESIRVIEMFWCFFSIINLRKTTISFLCPLLVGACCTNSSKRVGLWQGYNNFNLLKLDLIKINTVCFICKPLNINLSPAFKHFFLCS